MILPSVRSAVVATHRAPTLLIALLLAATACDSPVDPSLAIIPSQATVEFRAVRGSSTLLTRTIEVANTGGGRLGPVSCPAAPAPWLTCTVANGTQVTLTANPTGIQQRAEVTVPFTAAGIDASASVVASLLIDDPVLALSATKVDFTAAEGSSATNPNQHLVTVTNAGAGTLTDLGGISCIPNPASPVVRCSVDQGQGTLAVTVDPTGLGPGTYVFPLTISAPNSEVSPTLAVTLTRTALPRIALSDANLHFEAVRGSTSALTETVTVSNGGSGSLGTITCPSRPASWLTCSVSGSTLTLTADPSGVTQSVEATVNVSATGASNSPAPLAVALTIDQPILALSTESLTFDVVAGSDEDNERTVEVTNAGAGTRASLGTITCTRPSGAPLTCGYSQTTGELTVEVNTSDLDAGTEVHTLTVRAANSSVVRSITVTIRTESAASLVLSHQSLQFEAIRGSSSLITRTVTITNGGGGTIGEVPCPTISVGWLTCDDDADEEDETSNQQFLTFTANPSGRTTGDSETVEITATNIDEDDAVELDIDLNIGQPVLTLEFNSVTFTAVDGSPGETTPASRVIDVTNSGEGTDNDLGTIFCDVLDGAPVTCVENQTGNTITVTVNPEDRTTGTYVFFVEVSSSNMSNEDDATLVVILEVP